jgi:transcriptional regulator with XRE-family HTH domain
VSSLNVKLVYYRGSPVSSGEGSTTLHVGTVSTYHTGERFKLVATTGDRIRTLRERKGMTQDQLAEASQISKGFLSDAENNKRNISSQVLLRLANVLGASIDYLMRGELKEFDRLEAVVIPPELSVAARELDLSYNETLELLDAHNSVFARRSTRSQKEFLVEDWKQLYKAIKKVFG